MPSTNKTSFALLNQWIGTDKPKKDDFNTDNQRIDDAIRTHVNTAGAHVSDSDRAAWGQNAMVMGTYTGNGSSARTIELGFRPSFGVVFRKDTGCFLAFDGNITEIHTAFFSAQGCSRGVTGITATGFTVESTIQTIVSDGSPMLNISAAVYVYVAFK